MTLALHHLGDFRRHFLKFRMRASRASILARVRKSTPVGEEGAGAHEGPRGGVRRSAPGPTTEPPRTPLSEPPDPSRITLVTERTPGVHEMGLGDHSSSSAETVPPSMKRMVTLPPASMSLSLARMAPWMCTSRPA